VKILNPNLFDLNPNRTVSRERIGVEENEIIIIDDLFLYPMEIKQIIDSLFYTSDKIVRGQSPCWRSFIPMNGQQISRELIELNWKRYRIRRKSVKPFWLADQYLDKSNIIRETNYRPHIDTYNLLSTPYLAVVIYMNKVRLHGGTQFLRDDVIGESIHNKSDMEKLYEKQIEINRAKPWDYNPNEWQRYHLVPMKFNRLISYRTNMMHSIYTDGEYYRESSRKTITATF